MESQPIMPALAHRSDLAPRARHLLAQQLVEYGALLDPLFRDSLDDLEHELFAVAQKSSGGQAQHEAMEALREVKRNRSGFHAYLLAQLEHGFDGLGQSAEAGAPERPAHDAGELTLVDPHEFDETMALDDLSTRIELHSGNGLFDLCHRYAVLLAAPPLDNDALPTGPRALATALGQASHKLGLPREQRLLFYRLCDRRLFAAAEAIYTQLNERLKAAGILAHLRSYLRRRAPDGSTTEPSPGEEPEARVTAAADGPLPPPIQYSPPRATAPVRQPAPHPAMPAVDNAAAADLAELHRLLDTRRHLTDPAGTAAAAQTAQFASMPELQDALVALQALPSRKGGPQSGGKLADQLLAELRRTSRGEVVQLQPEHRDAVDLIGLLYDQLITETRREGVAQQLLANLQVPLLRVALSDSEFFTVRSHPARRLLNLVLETANLWLDRSGDQFDTALHQRLKRTVQHVADKAANDSQVIEHEADELEAHLQVLARRAEIAERRHVDAAQGRDRLLKARAKSRAAIASRIGKHNVSPLVRALLENAWTDALTLTLLRDGENSETYKRRLAAADQLLGPATARDDAALTSDLTHGLTQVGLQATEAEQVTRYALERPPETTGHSPTPAPSQTELLIRLKSRHKPEEPENAPAATTPKPLPLTPTERRALESLKALPYGSWLEFTINQQGQTTACKLAWYAPASGHCLLVTARGTPARERTLEQIARLIARGQARILPARGSGMIDRAWDALVASLRKLGGNRATLETAT